MANEELNQTESTSTESTSTSNATIIDSNCIVCNTPGYGDQFNPTYPTNGCGCDDQEVGHDPYCHSKLSDENLGTKPEDLSELHPRVGAVVSSGKEQEVYKTDDDTLPTFTIVPDGGDILVGGQVQLSIKLDEEYFTENVPNVIWQVSDLKYGYVSQDGVFYANQKYEGEVTVTATDYLDKNATTQQTITFNVVKTLPTE